MDTETAVNVDCPVCGKTFPQSEIEQHANKCIFLNCQSGNSNRKRSLSPDTAKSNSKLAMINYQKSPKISNTFTKQRFVFKKKTEIENATQNNETNLNSTIESQNVKTNTKAQYDNSFKVPLSTQVRPKCLDDFYGQNHVLGEGTMLRSLLEKSDIPNMILWGPPGCGKTSLSHVIREICKENCNKWKFVSLCAASCGIKEVQSIISIAKNDLKFGKRTVIFMDEIHRFNKKQQDTFLLGVERGDVILVGATTENPSFSLNNALLSRCKVIVMDKLQADDIYSIVENAATCFNVDVIDVDNPAGIFTNENAGLSIESSALKWLADISDGDAREALSNLQLILNYYNNNECKTITVADIEDKLKRAHLLYDKAGEEHYNIISAMHKSIRGSDDNAALYWTTRMILSGEDPRYIARRMVRAASEDIGNADPKALPLAIATMQGCQLIGMPEADVLLAQCAIYLARAPKSREADDALARAKKLIKEHKGAQPSVPMHIRNAPTTLMKNLGYGRLQDGEEFCFMPSQYKDVNFFS